MYSFLQPFSLLLFSDSLNSDVSGFSYQTIVSHWQPVFVVKSTDRTLAEQSCYGDQTGSFYYVFQIFSLSPSTWLDVFFPFFYDEYVFIFNAPFISYCHCL